MSSKITGALFIAIILAGCAAPSPQIIGETVLVTQQPLPTYTAYPTYTPQASLPTHTLAPTYTYTPYATDTPSPMATEAATATATNTPQPTETSTQAPASTPRPTDTTMPTNTIAPTDTPTPALVPGATRIREKDGAVMVYVPAGEFWMGSTKDDPYAAAWEKPQHKVYVDAFWIDQTEVTWRQLVPFVNAHADQMVGGVCCQGPGLCEVWCVEGVPWIGMHHLGMDLVKGRWQLNANQADYPASTSWYGAMAYSEWVGGRLPTEAEWEYAARGPDGRVYPWGNEFTCGRGNFGDAATGCNDGYPGEVLAPVGQFPDGASWCGALDMAGNVPEWTYTVWGSAGGEPSFWYPYNLQDGREDEIAAEYVDVLHPWPDVRRVWRGGLFRSDPRSVRCAHRANELAHGLVGFRVILPAD